MPSAADFTTTWAPATTLPCASLIVPSIVEIVVWANADKGNRTKSSSGSDQFARLIQLPAPHLWLVEHGSIPFMIPPPQEKVVGTQRALLQGVLQFELSAVLEEQRADP